MNQKNGANGAVILAGGEGKRMQSPLPKVLCEVLGRPLLDYVCDACRAVTDDLCVVVGFKADLIREHLAGSCETVFQEKQLGTANAVQTAEEFIRRHSGSLLVVCGDAPLMDAETLRNALQAHESQGNAVTVITAELDDPAAYGRIVKENGRLSAIVEFKDCTPDQKRIREINSGAFWFSSDKLLSILPRIRNDNAQHEFYLTDAVSIAIADGDRVGAYKAADPDVVMGANDPSQLKELEEHMMKKTRG